MEEKRLLLLSSVLIAIIVLVAIGSALSPEARSINRICGSHQAGRGCLHTGHPRSQYSACQQMRRISSTSCTRAESDPNAKAVVPICGQPGR